MAQNKPLGELLKEAGLINEEQIQIALDAQQASPMYFGEILEDLDFVTPAEVAQAVAAQNNLKYIDLNKIVPSKKALSLIPYDIAKNKNILPISLDDGILTVATWDINDVVLLDYLQNVSKTKIKYAIDDKKSIAEHIELFYYQLENPIEAEIQQLVKDTLNNKEIDIAHLVELFLNNAIKDRATDIHITPEHSASHVFYRIDGVLHHYYSIPKRLHKQMVARVKIVSSLNISDQRIPQDGSFSYTFLNGEFDLRVSTLPTNYGENIVMRLLGKTSSLYNLLSLGITEQNSKKIEKYFLKPYGVVLVTGPTGSGKTTTLYSALRKINSLHKNVLTVEDPIEYKFTFIKQTQLNEKAGYTFDAAIRAFMRQDPDVILVGEIRDHTTAELAIRASITGHLVLSTLHTNDAVSTIPRLEDLEIPPYLIASGLLAVIGQRLVRKLCPSCKKETLKSSLELKELGMQDVVEDGKEYKVYEAVGCEHCHQTGYIGRESIIEILEVDKEIQSLITKGASTFDLLKKARDNGMKSMKEDGFLKILNGDTTIDEVNRVLD